MPVWFCNQQKRNQLCCKYVVMYIKILILLNLVAFAFVASQPLFYLLALSKTQNNLQASSYIELRQRLDKALQLRLSIVYYVALAFAVALVVVSLVQSVNLLFFTALVAFLALVLDVMLALKTNIPINKIINQWNCENYPRHWQLIRRKWFYFYRIRQVAGITGFISLLVGAVFN